MKEITPSELKKMMDNKEDFQLIDVREEYEVEIANMDRELIPMADIMDNIDKITKAKKVVVNCRSRKRSGAVVQTLEKEGFKNVVNLKGGILAWTDEIDPSLTKY